MGALAGGGARRRTAASWTLPLPVGRGRIDGGHGRPDPEVCGMRSTMQETPLSLATLLRYGTTVHGTSEVVTWTGDGVRTATYAELGRRSAQLAHGLRALGVTGPG